MALEGQKVWGIKLQLEPTEVSCWSQIHCCCEVQSTLTPCVWWRMQSDGSWGHVINYERRKSISRRQALSCFSLLSLSITLALYWSKQLSSWRVNTPHNIQILGFSVDDFVSMWILACWGLHNCRATWQLLDSSLSLKNNDLNCVYRHEHFLLITTLSLVQTRNAWEWLLLQVR